MSYTQKNKIRYEQIYQITGKQKGGFQDVLVCGLLGSNPRQRYIPFLSPCHDLKGNLLRLCFPSLLKRDMLLSYKTVSVNI
jgi:hypothetical protein